MSLLFSLYVPKEPKKLNNFMHYVCIITIVIKEVKFRCYINVQNNFVMKLLLFIGYVAIMLTQAI